MATLVIENGCMAVQDAVNLWRYDYVDNTGSHVILFGSPVRPKIGDSLDTVTGTLTPLVGYTINNSPGMQKPCEDEGEWPSRIRAQ